MTLNYALKTGVKLIGRSLRWNELHDISTTMRVTSAPVLKRWSENWCIEVDDPSGDMSSFSLYMPDTHYCRLL